MGAERKRIVKNLESWYLIDSILFNNHAKNVLVKGKDFKEFVTLKASLLNNLYEFWTHINYQPVSKNALKNTKALMESAVRYAKKGKALASNIMNQPFAVKKIKSQIVKESKNKNVNVKSLSKKIIREKFLQISLDNCLIGIPVLESRKINQLKDRTDFKSEILTDAYKMIRGSLIHLSRTSQLKKDCCGK